MLEEDAITELMPFELLPRRITFICYVGRIYCLQKKCWNKRSFGEFFFGKSIKITTHFVENTTMYKKKRLAFRTKTFIDLIHQKTLKKRETNRQKKNQFNEIKKFTEIDKS